MTIDNVSEAFYQDEEYNMFKDVYNHLNNEYETYVDDDDDDTPVFKFDDSWLPYLNVYIDDELSDDETEEETDETEESVVEADYDEYYDIRFAYT
jgi:hypothetical protein